MIFLFSLFALFVIYYILILRSSDFFLVKIINTIFSHVGNNLGKLTLLGAVYAAFFGGLFFITLPIEAIFIAFLHSEFHPFLVMSLFVGGLFVSYSIDYLIGYKLSNFSKKLIPPKKFYKTKNLINKYGPVAIFVINVLPLPSQILATVLGVFKYNRTRFYIFFLSGQITKYVLITIFYLYIAA